MTISFILLLVGAILLLLAALNVSSSRVSLGWLGLCFWAVSILLAGK